MHRSIRIKADNLTSDLREALPNCKAVVTLLGARELLESARQQPTYTLELRFIESPISVGDSYIVLATLPNYFQFITDDSGALRKYIFESNVRDFQGDVEVNKDIKWTLDQQEQSPDFWWLNNGVTIIASKASITGKLIALDEVQIVNGLQTSFRIHEYISADHDSDEERSLLCRVIVTDNIEIRDRVIKATNFQTTVSAVSLRAHDPIQRDIETFLLSSKWYYDRRKNYYKNLGRPADRIIGVGYLGQAIMAMGLSEPDNSRARPTTLIKDDDDYKRVFDENVNLSVFQWAASTMKRIDSFLRSAAAPGSESEKRELRFHLAMWITASALGEKVHHPSQLEQLTDMTFTDEELKAGMNDLVKLLKTYPDATERPLDRVAKSRDFVDHLLAAKFGTASKTSSSGAGRGATRSTPAVDGGKQSSGKGRRKNRP